MFQIIGLILIGLVIGVLARLVLPGRQSIGLLRTLLLGVAGAVIGGIIADIVGLGDIFELNVGGFVLALIASVLLLGGAERAGLLRESRRDQLERRAR